MEILKAEIARKRKELEEKNLLQNNRKYFKRGDLLATELRTTNDTNSSNKTDSQGSTATHENLIQDNAQILPRAEVVRKLRERGEPILLFAETETDAFKRLRKSEILAPEINKGLRNDFQEAMDQVDQAYLDEILESSKPGEQRKKGDVPVPDAEITYEDIQKMAEKLDKNDRETDMKIITQFLQFLLKLWGDQLNSRRGAEKMSTKGKMDGAIYAQTGEYLKPLLRKLKNKSLPEDITDSLTEIVKQLLDRNYILASDAYLQMAIGNSPWPIGVTMVGIHARTGREKIFSKNVAHVMNDETQRKYIQALKRLMTKCQEYYPTDPSRCVEYSKFS
ncbi:pre-mRNA-splicing factor 18 [Copidosoma floridanum]|uniref:pre-mRNA-splicing factor 18 n=1 Tax=Copidosoma floridanum TaxID=29053 RepID=UPI0006C9735A|nr:pre-mRNA-splicing factor 18 [Copidosoma floridanum]XP_014218716.1 pre-mRNA-splicing factor 18 [Copidosoma floridanum]